MFIFLCDGNEKGWRSQAYNNILSDWKSLGVFLMPGYGDGVNTCENGGKMKCLYGFHQSYSKRGWNVTCWGWYLRRWKLSKLNNMIYLRKISDDVKRLLLLIKLNIFRNKHLIYLYRQKLYICLGLLDFILNDFDQFYESLHFRW